MRLIHHHWLFLVVVITVCLVTYLLGTIIDIFLEEKQKESRSPRAEMFWCAKHGLFPKEHCIQLFPHLGDNIQNAWICPTCYREKVFIDPDKRLKNG